MLPLVLSEGVSVDLLQVTFELMLQRVNQQDVTGLLVQQLGGPRDRRQEGHETGHTAVLKVLHQEFVDVDSRKEKCRKHRKKIKVMVRQGVPFFTYENPNLEITFSITSRNESFNNFDIKL